MGIFLNVWDLTNLDPILIFKETFMKTSDLTHNVDETFNHIKSGAHDAIDKVVHVTTQAADALSHKGDQLHDMERQALKNSRNYIQDNPVTSLGIAVGVGFLLSRLLSSR
jgi:ElaB/YqjD/DUF883 family membrane-anchored ribosome-binding protein